MTKRFLTLAALTALVFACAPKMRAAVVTELDISDGFGDSVSITVDNITNLVTVTCNSGFCGNVAAKSTTDGSHGTISVTHATFGTGANTFTLSATGVGGEDSTLPTLQDLNQINASANAAGSTLTATFTDTCYGLTTGICAGATNAAMSGVLNVADSNVTDVGIASSTITFRVSTDGGDAIPAGTQISNDAANTLTGHSSSNAVDGLNYLNSNLSGSLTTQTLMSFTGTGGIQANISVSNVSVPEPAGIVLLGTAILGLTAVFRKRQTKRS